MLEADKAVYMASMIWVSLKLTKCIKDLVYVCVICVSPDEAQWLLHNTVLRGASCFVERLMEEVRDKGKEEREREKIRESEEEEYKDVWTCWLHVP